MEAIYLRLRPPLSVRFSPTASSVNQSQPYRVES